METIIFVFLSIFNVISAVLAAITAYLYFWLPVTQNSHGTCVFHFSLNIALMHAVLTVVKSGSKIFLFIGEYCVIEAYVFCFLVATVHVWSVILSYSTWNEVKQAKFVNRMYPKTRLIYYRFFGYGVPTLYVAFVIFFVQYVFHIPKRVSFCFSDMEYIQALPSLGSIFVNIFFFNDSQRRLSRLFPDVNEVQNENNSPPKSFKTKLKYKKCLNLKLCLTMSIPFGLCSIISVIVESIIVKHDENYLLKLLELTHFLLTSLQGTSIFLVAVVFRKIVMRSFIKHRHRSYLGSVRIPEYLRKRSTKDDVEETADDESGIHSDG